MSPTSPLRANPYVGPRAFQYGETLHGRDREVIELLDLLIAERIVLLYSPSGAGKTSLIQAGLSPALEQEDFQVLPVMRVSLEPPPGLVLPGGTNRYVLSVLLSLEEARPEAQQRPVATLASMTLADYLAQREAADATQPVVLMFDQFEEILTVNPTDRAAKEAFFTQLGAALQPRHRWALFAMREEYPAALDPYVRPLPTRLSTTFRLELLGEAAARLAMQQPARDAGVDFTDAAAQQLVNDLRRVRVQRAEGTTEEQAGLYVEPVHLQVVCHRLWERLAADAQAIGVTDVEAVGDVDSALAEYYAERVLATARETGVRERAMREWFDRHLITEQGMRGQVLQGPERSQGLENRAIGRLVDVHLVRAEKRRGATWFELSHDRLIEPVRQNNVAWYQAHLSALQRQAALWEEQDRPDSLLLRDEALADAERWATTQQEELTASEGDFLAACQEARALAERERRQARRIRRWAKVAILVSVVAILAFVAAYISFVQAQRALAIISEIDHAAPFFKAIKRGHKQPITSVSFSPDGTRLAAASADGYVYIGDASSDADSMVLTLHKAPVKHVAFSHKGRYVISAGQDGVAIVSSTTEDAPVIALRGHTDAVNYAAFSPDDRMVVTASSDHTARVWDVQTRQEISVIQHNGAVNHAAFSDDGKLLITASDDGTAAIWNTATQQLVRNLKAHSLGINHVTFSHNGKFFATASADNTTRVWDTRTGDLLAAVQRYTAEVKTVVFSPDDTMILTVGKERTALVVKAKDPETWKWHADDNARTGDTDGVNNAIFYPLTGHTDEVNHAIFSRDGTLIITTSQDRTARVWQYRDKQWNVAAVLTGHIRPLTGVDFNDNLRYVVTGSDDHTVRVWDLSQLGADLRVAASLKAESNNFSGACPVTMRFSGTIRIQGGGGKVTYQYVRSDGGTSPPEVLAFDAPGAKEVSTTWQLDKSEPSAWVAMQILAPQAIQSDKATLSVDCRNAAAQTAPQVRQITAAQLPQIMPKASLDKRTLYLPHLQRAMEEFDIDTPLRQAAFLAEVAYETSELTFMDEGGGGEQYEGRRDLGNTEPGDGQRFKGRGVFFITGRANYVRFGKQLGIDLISNPSRAAEPDVAFRTAGLYWQQHGLNELADQQDLSTITRRIYGGLHGLQERLNYYEKAKQVLGVQESEPQGKP